MNKIDKAINILCGATEESLTPIQQLITEYITNHIRVDTVKEALIQIQYVLEVLTGPEDIYEINTPFGLLDSETRQKLVNTFKLEYYDGTTWKILNGGPYQHPHYTIRAVKPKKASINWDHVDDKFKWLTMDQDGIYFLYAEKPEFDEEDGLWKAELVDCIEPAGFKSFVPGTCAAKDSLVERPKNEV